MESEVADIKPATLAILIRSRTSLLLGCCGEGIGAVRQVDWVRVRLNEEWDERVTDCGKPFVIAEEESSCYGCYLDVEVSGDVRFRRPVGRIGANGMTVDYPVICWHARRWRVVTEVIIRHSDCAICSHLNRWRERSSVVCRLVDLDWCCP